MCQPTKDLTPLQSAVCGSDPGAVEKIALRPGPKRSDIEGHLAWELHMILKWVERRAIGKARNANTPGVRLSGVSESVVTGAYNHQSRHLIQVAI